MSETAGSNRFLLTLDVVGKPVGFAAVKGEVVAVERWTETHVGSAAGSVFVSGNQVAVAPPRVWATAIARKAVWIKTDADEIQVPVPDSLQVRQGHMVSAIVATGVNNGESQWAAVVNRDTNRWTQIDRFPPCGSYDPFTSVIMALCQGGEVAVRIMALYGVVSGGSFALLGQSWMSLVWGGFIGMGAGFVHSMVGIFQSRASVGQYAAAVKAACDKVFAASG